MYLKKERVLALGDKMHMKEWEDRKIDEIMVRLSLREKIGQLNQVCAALDDKGREKLKNQVRSGSVGSVILAFSATAGNDEQHDIDVEFYEELQRIAVEESPNGIPLIYGRDVIHGHRTVMPIPLASACSFDPDLVERCYASVAAEACNDGIHWTFSPMVDVCHDPRWGRIVEGAGEDPYLSSRMAAAIVKGFQGDDYAKRGKLAACVKHYLGYGTSEGGRDYYRTELSDYTTYNMILPPFRAAVEAGVATVMSSFNDINGQPVICSKKYLTDILRDKIGFDGFVISDWAGISDIIRQGVAEDEKQAAAMTMQAGLDMDMVDEYYVCFLESLVQEGEVSVEQIDRAVRNILRVKLRKGLFEQPYTQRQTIDRAEHMRQAYKLAAASMVLLKNEHDVLPLKDGQHICLSGPLAMERRSLLGTWTLDGKEDETENFYEALCCTVGEKQVDLQVQTHGFEKVTDESVIVLALGESHLVSGERNSVADISLTNEQIALAQNAHESGKKVVGVFFCGRPIALQNVEPYLDAILYAWHGGSCTAKATADIIFGRAEPTGRTAVTFVKTTGHIPLYYNTTPTGWFNNGYYGERPEACYLDIPAVPMYPFGYGLSYAAFEYSAIKTEKTSMLLPDLVDGENFRVSVVVENSSDRDGVETVQLYVRDKVASAMRPMRELKAFKKVHIGAHKRKTVSFTVGYHELGFYTENGEYIVEPGKFDIYIGENCLTKHCVTINVEK